MRWIPSGTSRNVEDRRRFGGGGLRLGLGGTLILLVLSAIFGRDFLGVFSGVDQSGPPAAVNVSPDSAEGLKVQFVSFVLDDVQRAWAQILPAAGENYRDAQLVLFRDTVDSACGFADAATGPFYCPRDEKVYLDLSFFEELDQRFGAPGDFAQAYVIAHEVGHHVQNLLGISDKVQRLQQARPAGANNLSVRLELQADCLAGVWGNSTRERNILEEGDVEEGLNAAAAIGDDRLQRMARGRVSPESFTHGSSEKRVTWFRRGLQSGRLSACDTFSAN